MKKRNATRTRPGLIQRSLVFLAIAAGAAIGIILRAHFHPHVIWNVLKVIDTP